MSGKKLLIGNNNPLKTGGGSDLPIISPEQADYAVYGGIEAPSSNRIVARPVKIMSIRPDMAQPRRIIPAKIRKGWTGDPKHIERMLREWHVACEKAIGEVIDVILHIDRLTLEGREADKTDMPPMVEDYLSLLALASSIKRDGLTNPITVAGDKIETGERRYMAHHLLNAWFPDDGFDSIPAVQVKNVDVWKQASENGNRKELNAVGMARQLALLIMDMYRGDDGVKFDDIGFFDHEQKFYAQVANGNIWRIKKGYGERILQVTGLKSRSQVNQYRSLLEIKQDLWDEADANNWAEFRIREMVKPRDMSTVVDVSANQPTMADMVFNKFADAMRAGLRQYVHLNKDGNGLFGRGQSKMFVWWNRAFNGFEIITESGGYVQAGRAWDIELVIKQMYANQPDNSKWGIVKKTDWDAMVNPPLPNTFAPQPAVTPSFDAKKAMADIVGDDDGFDDEYADESPIVPRPFGGGVVSHPSNGEAQVDAMDAPHDYPNDPPHDPRYVAKRKPLHHFLGMMVKFLEAFGEDGDDWAEFRDLSPAGLKGKKFRLSNDDIAQQLSNWQTMVLDATAEINSLAVETLAEIWADVEKKS